MELYLDGSMPCGEDLYKYSYLTIRNVKLFFLKTREEISFVLPVGDSSCPKSTNLVHSLQAGRIHAQGKVRSSELDSTQLESISLVSESFPPANMHSAPHLQEGGQALRSG